jgi:hypothetical protein
MEQEEQIFQNKGTNLSEQRNKTLASAKQVGTKKGYMRNKTLASVEQVGTRKKTT